jgi:hypothetical protein
MAMIRLGFKNGNAGLLNRLNRRRRTGPSSDSGTSVSRQKTANHKMARVANEPGSIVEQSFPPMPTNSRIQQPGSPPYRVVHYDSEGLATVEGRHERYDDAVEQLRRIANRGFDGRLGVIDASNRRIV